MYLVIRVGSNVTNFFSLPWCCCCFAEGVVPALQPANRNVFNYLPQSIKMQVRYPLVRMGDGLYGTVHCSTCRGGESVTLESAIFCSVA